MNHFSAHCASELWSATLWQIREEVIKSVGAANDADKIVLRSYELIKCNPNAGFNESANAIVNAAEDLQKSGRIDMRVDINKIKSVLKEKGFPIKNKIRRAFRSKCDLTEHSFQQLFNSFSFQTK
ncbi:MAG: hypothetical protein IPK14_25250 [Blastocatellia bacterium]|nr:hypothetical protein [Blastocatellia bacterium]